MVNLQSLKATDNPMQPKQTVIMPLMLKNLNPASAALALALALAGGSHRESSRSR